MLTVHYEHYARFYGNGMLSQTALGVASTEDKVQTALVIMRLLNTLAAKVCCYGNHSPIALQLPYWLKKLMILEMPAKHSCCTHIYTHIHTYIIVHSHAHT